MPKVCVLELDCAVLDWGGFRKLYSSILIGSTRIGCPLHRPRCSVLRELSKDIEVRSACQQQTHKMSKQRDDSNIKSRDLGPIDPVEPRLSRGESTAVDWVWGGGLRFLQETLLPRSNAWTALRLAIITRLELLSRLRREACTSSTLLEYSKESCDATF